MKQRTKFICFTCLSILSMKVCFTQDKYRITYDNLMYFTEAFNAPDSIEMLTPNRDTSELPFKKIINKLKIDPKLMHCTVQGDNNGSTLIRTAYPNPSWRNKNSNEWPDSLVFRNKNWYKYKADSISLLAFRNTIYTYVDEYKIIMGYECQRVKIHFIENDQDWEAWISPNLPNTLIPLERFKPLRGAILQLINLKGGFRYVVTSISKI